MSDGIVGPPDRSSVGLVSMIRAPREGSKGKE